MMDERQRRRIFQWIKTLSNEKFWSWMNWVHSRAYAAAVQHYTEAAEIVLPPRLQKQLHEKAREIREEWDGMVTVTLDDTTGQEFDQIMGRLRGNERTEMQLPNLPAPATHTWATVPVSRL